MRIQGIKRIAATIAILVLSVVVPSLVATAAEKVTLCHATGQDDSTHYHSHDRDGMRVQYSGWIHVSRHLSPELLNKAIRRYQVERKARGQAEIRVQVSEHGHLSGPDISTPNTCGGRAVWASDAINEIAWNMRPNGCLVRMKA